LNPKYYAEINVETWPFYTESEKATVKRNIAVNIIKKTDATSPPVVSSTSKSPEEKSLKRTPPDVMQDRNNKKQKLEANEEPSSTSVSPPKNPISKEEQKKLNHIGAKNGSKENEAVAAQHVGDESPPTVASTSDSPEYLSTYKPISTREQRLQYKRDFQLEYPEYIELKTNLDGITRRFMELDKKLKKCSEGSADYLLIQEEIMNAYNKQLKDEKYHTMKSRCEELHQKLGHIKRLVCDYDQQMVNS
jgi:RNA polymerase II elongation factor ELL